MLQQIPDLAGFSTYGISPGFPIPQDPDFWVFSSVANPRSGSACVSSCFTYTLAEDQAVPEPGSLALLLLSLGIAGTLQKQKPARLAPGGSNQNVA